MLDILHAICFNMGWTILALSLASDHLDFLGMAQGWTILAHKVIYYYLEPGLDSLHILSISWVRVGALLTRNFIL